MYFWRRSSLGENKLLLWLEILAKKFIPEVDLEINFVKAVLKKMKNCMENKDTDVFPLRGDA